MSPIETPWASRFLWVVAVLFLLLGLGYSSVTPIFENSDETLHYPYIKHLADGQGLPLAQPGQLWNQEGTQHPLYYAIVAATTFWLDSANLPDLLQRNPHWRFAEARSLINDNQNLVLHGPADAFPYRRAALAVHIGRWWSLVFGLVTVVCTFLIGRHLWPQHLSLTVTATALTAFTPQFIRVSSTVSNDSLSAALTSLAVLAALKWTSPRSFGSGRGRPLRPPAAAPWLLGLLCGLALLTKLSSLSTLFIVAIIIWWRLFFLGEQHQRPLRLVSGWLGLIAGLTLALTGWWFYRNYQLYGEWLALETHLNLAGRGHLSLAEVWQLRAEVERAYWATLGWGQIRPPEWLFTVLAWFSRIGLIGLALAGLTRLIQGNKGQPLPLNVTAINFEVIIFLGLWLGLNLILYLRWVMEVGSVSHTRLIFPAITAISLLLAVGWQALLPARLAGWFSGLVIVLLLGLNLYCVTGLLYPAFTPIKTPPQRVATHPLALTFRDGLRLEQGQVYAGREAGRAVSGADEVILEAHWRVLAEMPANYSVAASLLAPDGRVLAQRETYPGLGLRPTRYLIPGTTFVDLYPLQLEQSLTSPMVAQAIITVFDLNSDNRAGFPAYDSNGQVVNPVVGQLKIIPRPWPDYRPSRPLGITFNDTIELVGYDYSPAALTLYWQVLAPLDRDYHVFVHGLDRNGSLIGQADGPPTGNAYPTRWWEPGEIIADRRAVPATAGLAAIRLGLYQLETGERLVITASNLPQQNNAVEITLP